jgi:hypothetical protein
MLNPCVDCKILLLRKALELMREYGAQAVITGEVLGQRPMSQRLDALNIIKRESGVGDLLLRPLCARLLPATAPEQSGFIDRSALLALSGRNRKGQLALAGEFGITDIPTPAGGCLLTEQEKARAYWSVLRFAPAPAPTDFAAVKYGRQYWLFDSPALDRGACMLSIGRNREDNERLEQLGQKEDLLFLPADFTGPTALGRVFAGRPWAREEVLSAAAFTASFAPKAVRSFARDGRPLAMRVRANGEENILEVKPERAAGGGRLWNEYPWEKAREEIRAEARAKAQARS